MQRGNDVCDNNTTASLIDLSCDALHNSARCNVFNVVGCTFAASLRVMIRAVAVYDLSSVKHSVTQYICHSANMYSMMKSI